MSNDFLIDTHAHVSKVYYEDVLKLLDNSLKKDVKYIITSGYDIDSSKEAIELVKKHDNLYCSIGIHPHEANEFDLNNLSWIEKSLNNNKVIAIGEIGLDYYYEEIDVYKQQKLFEEQLKLAEKYSLPVIIHSRESSKDVISILKKYKVKGIIHSFNDSLADAKEYIKLGFLLGINGVVTFKNSNLKNILKNIDLKHIVLETDSPYLTPVPYRGKKNSPSNLIYIAKYLEEIYQKSLEEIKKETTKNVNNLFDNIFS